MKYLSRVVVVASLLLMVLPAMAQEEAAPAGAAGVGWLFLLVGLGAALAIGVVSNRRENSGPADIETPPSA